MEKQEHYHEYILRKTKEENNMADKEHFFDRYESIEELKQHESLDTVASWYSHQYGIDLYKVYLILGNPETHQQMLKIFNNEMVRYWPEHFGLTREDIQPR